MGNVFVIIYILLALTLTSVTSSPSNIRLMNGTSPSSGRVEVYYNGKWGTICDDLFDRNDAIVICRMLGFHNTWHLSAYQGAHYGQGSGDIIIDDLACTGNETTLSDCPSRPWMTTNCGHGEDASVDCVSVTLSPTDMRLMNGSSPSSTFGRVEVYYQGQWGTICDRNFNHKEASVICKMLGFNNTRHVHAYQGAAYGQGTGEIIADIACNGNETTLSDCHARPAVSTNCGHSHDAGVNCVSVELSPNDIRLMDRSSPSSTFGRVEVYYQGHWRTICDRNFDRKEASVICRMLGFNNTGHVHAYQSAAYGQGSGDIIADIACTGNEATLSDCPSKLWMANNCGHYQDAGVNCVTCVTIEDKGRSGG